MTITFKTELRVAKENGTWRLLTPFVVKSGEALFIVPEGFETDFASVPRLPFTYAFAGNIGHRSAVVHDFLYAIGHDRADADEVFRACLEAEGVGAFKRGLMYAAVRAFGGAAYAKHAEARAAAVERIDDFFRGDK